MFSHLRHGSIEIRQSVVSHSHFEVGSPPLHIFGIIHDMPMVWVCGMQWVQLIIRISANMKLCLLLPHGFRGDGTVCNANCPAVCRMYGASVNRIVVAMLGH